MGVTQFGVLQIIHCTAWETNPCVYWIRGLICGQSLYVVHPNLLER